MDCCWLAEHPHQQVGYTHQWLVDFQGSHFSSHIKQLQKAFEFKWTFTIWKIIPLADIFSSESIMFTSTTCNVVAVMVACSATCFFLAIKSTKNEIIIIEQKHVHGTGWSTTPFWHHYHWWMRCYTWFGKSTPHWLGRMHPIKNLRTFWVHV